MNKDEIAIYLNDHLEFFNEYPELLTKIKAIDDGDLPLAPTGTIGLMMDCDTTGVEPDLALVKYKKLVGGGLMKIVNQTVPTALARPR